MDSNADNTRSRRRRRWLISRPGAILAALTLTFASIVGVVGTNAAAAQVADDAAVEVDITFAQALYSGPVDVVVDGRSVGQPLRPDEILSQVVRVGAQVSIAFRPAAEGVAAIAPDPVTTTVDVSDGRARSVIAYLDGNGDPAVQSHTLPSPAGNQSGFCVVLHHALIGPLMDVLLDENVARRGLRPGDMSQPLSVTDSTISVGVAPAGSTLVLATLSELNLAEGQCVAVYATGDLAVPDGVVLHVRGGATVEAAADWNHILGPAEVTFHNLVTGLPIGVQLGDGMQFGRQLVGQMLGPYSTAGGPLPVELEVVHGDGSAPRTVTLTVPISGGTITDLVAHRSLDGEATVTAFVRNLQPLPEDSGCVVVRHAGSGPPIDVLVDDERLATGVEAGESSDRLAIEPGRVKVRLNPSGVPVELTEPISVNVTRDECFVISLIGNSGSSIALWESRYTIGTTSAPEQLASIPTGGARAESGLRSTLAAGVESPPGTLGTARPPETSTTSTTSTPTSSTTVLVGAPTNELANQPRVSAPTSPGPLGGLAIWPLLAIVALFGFVFLVRSGRRRTA